MPDEPAILIDGTVLALADLHLGLEVQLREAGVHVPSQAGKMAARLERIVDATGARTLVLLGDVKHLIPRMASPERRDVHAFFARACDLLEDVHIVAGNHDGMLRNIVPGSVRFHPAHGFRLGDASFCHGHAWPSRPVMEADVLLMGHNHPAVFFRDVLGHRQVVPCWFRAPFRRRHPRYPRMPREAIVVPSFNELCGGVPMNDARVDYLGPILDPAVLRLDRATLHLLDGTDLGRLGDLRTDTGWRGEDYRQ